MKQQLGYWDQQWFYKTVNFAQMRDLQALALRISSTGNGPLYVVAALALLLIHEQGSAFFYAGMVSFAIELPLYLLLKNAIRRTRPCHSLAGISASFEPSDKFSLPSGHSAAAFVMASLVYWFFPVMAPLTFAWASLIAISRVMLGVHYPLDIVAGMSLGMGSVWCAYNLFH
ncbi:phosphatase PAP2 family protein [Shewanella sp. WXL01]|uniref:undecaprenyl-diphosphate phosphatase n=1 Tax=Shewanella maritima TaxID=2520507 RepID=A0A411PJ65_9GAMM|nr:MULTISPECIES: phosphatase PAP2 family protein [Shewanella]NKF51273.1 phosphatase PAP2 family protein [Shewanella sp. WXL01]QBF83583.1 phosphatase PAP2 family protein [Shewanella maritima]